LDVKFIQNLFRELDSLLNISIRLHLLHYGYHNGVLDRVAEGCSEGRSSRRSLRGFLWVIGFLDSGFGTEFCHGVNVGAGLRGNLFAVV
jgi:hypothetical protein